LVLFSWWELEPSLLRVPSSRLGEITLRLRTEFEWFQSIIWIPFLFLVILGHARLVFDRKFVSWFAHFCLAGLIRVVLLKLLPRVITDPNVLLICLRGGDIWVKCTNSQKCKWSETHPILVLTFFVEKGPHQSHTVTCSPRVEWIMPIALISRDPADLLLSWPEEVVWIFPIPIWERLELSPARIIRSGIICMACFSSPDWLHSEFHLSMGGCAAWTEYWVHRDWQDTRWQINGNNHCMKSVSRYSHH
jgi:hypothetical protein